MAVANAVVSGEVRRRLGGSDQVVGRQSVDRRRHRDLANLGTGGGKGISCGSGLSQNLGLEPVSHLAGAHQLGDETNSQAGNAVIEVGNRRLDHLRNRGGVARVVTGDDIEQRGGISDGLGERADLIER